MKNPNSEGLDASTANGQKGDHTAELLLFIGGILLLIILLLIVSNKGVKESIGMAEVMAQLEGI